MCDEKQGAYIASKYLLQGTYNYEGKMNNFKVEKPDDSILTKYLKLTLLVIR